MAQQHLMLGTYQPPDVDEDGYQVQFATTSTASSGRTQRGNMINTTMFTVEAYSLKWTNISAVAVKKILEQVMGKNSFSFYHFNVYSCQWEEGEFYVANINSPFYSLEDGEERVEELSFQVTGINPV